MSALLDHLDRLKGVGGNEKKNASKRGNKGSEPGGQDQRKRIERPNRRVIVVRVINFLTAMLGARGRNTIEMRIEMRVDESGMIVIRSRSVPGVNVLERRQ